MKTIQYSVVIPAFNEEPVIAETYKRLKKVMESPMNLFLSTMEALTELEKSLMRFTVTIQT